MYENKLFLTVIITALLFSLTTGDDEFNFGFSEFLIEIRDTDNNKMCYGSLISSNMIIAPASCVQGKDANNILIMLGDQSNLTSVENLPDFYFQRLIYLYEKEYEQFVVNDRTSASLAERIEYLKQLSRDEVEKISEADVRRVSTVAQHPLFHIDEIYNCAVLTLRVAMPETAFNQLYFNLAYNIPNDLSYGLATHSFDFQKFETVEHLECIDAFPNYSNYTHFCLKSYDVTNDTNDVLGKPIVNGPMMYGFALEKTNIVSEESEYELLVAVHTAKFVSFTQIIESGQDFDAFEENVFKIVQTFIQKLLKQFII